MTFARLDELAAVESGGTPSRSRPDYFGGSIPWVKIGDLHQRRIFSTAESITEAGLASSSAKLLPAGTLLLSIFASIGRTAVLERPAATNQAIAGIRVGRPDAVDAAYLLRFLESAAPGLAAQGRGAAQPNINLSILRSLRIPLPPLDEQRRIAAILDHADELRAKRRAAIAHLDSLTDAILLDMFGDPALSQRFVALGDITASARLGLVRSSKQLSEGGPYPYIRMNAISADGRLDSSSLQRTFASRDELASSTLDRGDLLFNTRNSRDLVGKCAVFRGDERCLFNNNLLRLRFTDGIAPEFVWAVLNSTYGKRELMSRASGTTSVFAIYAKDLASVPIPLADPDRQALFSDAVAEVDSNRSQHTTSLSALDVLFASLQARAFAGDL